MEATSRLILHPADIADASAHFAIHGDPATNRHNPSGPLADIAESEGILSEWQAHWREHGFGYWAVRLGDDQSRIIGFGGVANRPIAGEIRLNLYFRFSPAVWGRGLATEMASHALAAVRSRGIARPVHALVRPDNLASIAVLKRLGMVMIAEVDDVPEHPPSLLFATRATP